MLVLYLVLVVVPSCFGQGTPIVTGAGYTLPAPVNVAPGQILTVYVQGIGSALTQPVRNPGYPLPTSLAGISATLQQGSNRPLGILDVRTSIHAWSVVPVRYGGVPSKGIELWPSHCGDGTDSFQYSDHLFNLRDPAV